jgi:hypothetical protein
MNQPRDKLLFSFLYDFNSSVLWKCHWEMNLKSDFLARAETMLACLCQVPVVICSGTQYPEISSLVNFSFPLDQIQSSV